MKFQEMESSPTLSAAKFLNNEGDMSVGVVVSMGVSWSTGEAKKVVPRSPDPQLTQLSLTWP